MKIKAIILGLFAMTIAFASQAQTTPKVANRQVNQQKRIRSGYKSGALTKKEGKGRRTGYSERKSNAASQAKPRQQEHLSAKA